jgi:hypothetical protein
MNSTSIDTCRWCEQPFCCECSTAKEWARFCSEKCERNWHEDIEREAAKITVESID